MTTAVAEDRVIEFSLMKAGNLPTKLKGNIEVPECLGLLNDPAATPPKGFGCMRIPTIKDGDKRVIWDKADIQQIAEAQITFNKLIAEGMKAFRVGLDGKKSAEEIHEFDPHAEEIIFVQMQVVTGG